MGGQGQCGPNTLVYLVGLVQLTELDGPGLRKAVAAHSEKSEVLQSTTSVMDEGGNFLTVEELIELNVKHWPQGALEGLSPTVENWRELIVRPKTWTDVAFTQLTADLFSVSFHHLGVDDLSQLFDMGVISPCNGRASVALCSIGVWYNRHFTAVVDLAISAAAEPHDEEAGRPPHSVDALGSLGLQFPLTSLDQVRLLLASPSAPTMLVGFEFSGAVRSALEAAGHVAISADLRPCEIGGLHFQGDVRDLLTLTVWERAYLFPPCYQQLRFDVDCIEDKILDMRAFWGCAMVLMCICVTTATAVFVEQPDTLVADCFDHTAWPNLRVFEFRTSHYGDPTDKFVRLTVRNARLEAPPFPLAAPAREPRSQWDYVDADARDRARSSWQPHVLTTAALVRAAPINPVSDTIPLAVAMEAFAREWHAQYGSVPSGYLSPAAAPLDAESRDYQLQRGHGDGRRPPAVLPLTLSCAHITVRSDGSIVSYEAEDEPDSDELLQQGQSLADAAIAQGSSKRVTIVEPQEEDAFGAPPEPFSPESSQVVDLREATEAMAVVLFICVLGQPLILAHVNGFSVLGVHTSQETRSAMLRRMQLLCAALVSAVHMVFMIGQYVAGLRLFAAPVDFAPLPRLVCRSRAQRLAWLARGATFVWCTLGALHGTPIADAAGRAFATTAMFRAPVSELPDAPSAEGVRFEFGASSMQSVATRSADERNSPVWASLQRMVEWSADLVQSIQADVSAGDSLLEGWADRVLPFDITSVPADLLESAPSFEDDRLDGVSLSAIPEPLRLPWLPLPPRQEPAGPDTPECPRISLMLLPAAKEKLRGWFEDYLADLVGIRDQLAAGVPPGEVQRNRPANIAIGQSEQEEWSRWRVWDCRAVHLSDGCCEVLDFHADIETHLHRDYLGQRLHHYPDQHLVANLLEGVRLEADVELQFVGISHLSSLPLGFSSVNKELRRLHNLNWYDFFAGLPFWPPYLNGQGAAARRLEPDRYRRTTEGGGPRQAIFDASGLQAISINEASHVYHMPQHFLRDTRPEFVAWLQKRGLPATSPEPASTTTRFSKWPKERKPQLASVMRDTAVFGRAGAVIGAPVFGFSDDAKDYFSQLAMATSELHKLNIAFLAEPGDFSPADDAGEPGGVDNYATSTARPPGHRDRLLFVSEKRLGFGTHGASNIAQRFSDALLDLFREDMDEVEARLRRSASAAELEWLQRRLSLQRRLGEPCVDIRRWTRPASEALPDIAAPSSVGGIPDGYVCPQLRLYSCYIFTDDPYFIMVGTDRTKEGLRTMRRLTNRVGLLMAIPEKRSLGPWCKWLGVNIVSSLGLVTVPQDKILRASAAIAEALDRGVEFHVWRSLCGLLEHLRAVNLQSRNVMFGLYRPHGPTGASRHGPNGWVTCDSLMRKQLQRWQNLLFRSCGVSVKRALLRDELDPAPKVFVDVTSDACLADVARAGIGGFCHGLYWFYEIPEEDRPYLTIPVLEFLAVACGVLIFFPYLRGLCHANAEARILLRTDALTSALALPASSANSEVMQEADELLRASPEWQALLFLLAVAHLYGDCNPASDLISRQRWTEFHRLCAVLGIRPRQVPVTPRALELIQTTTEVARQASHRSGYSVSAAPAPPPPPFQFTVYRTGGPAKPSLALRKRLSAEPQEQLASPSPATVSPPWPTGPNSPSRLILAKLEAGLGHPPSAQPATESADNRPKPPPPALPVHSPPPPKPPAASALREASRRYAHLRLQGFSSGDDPSMAFSADMSRLLAVSDALEDAALDGANVNTLKVDERAWRLFEHVCEEHGTSPFRTEEDVQKHPMRNAHLLAALLLHATIVCKPKSKDRQMIKPSSAMAYPLAIIRIFGRWGIKFPGFKFVSKALDGFKRRYLAFHGPDSLAPRRAENMKFAMVLRMERIPCDGSVTIGRLVWNDNDHNVFIFRRLSRVMMFTAFRLGEIVGNGSTEIFYLTFASLVWRIDGVMHRNPTEAQLRSMRPGRDKAFLFPPRSKPDQMGEIHCPFPVTLTYELTELNPAAALRDLELRVGIHVADRASHPLFADAAGRTYSHGFLHNMLRSVLSFLYGATVASTYSWHSYRSGLATALHAAKVEDSMIQLICRWMCPESLHVYRRMGTREHERLINKASAMNVEAIQSGNVVRVVGDEQYAALLADLSVNPAHARSYAETEKRANNPFNRQLHIAQEPEAEQQPKRQPRRQRTQPPAATPDTPTSLTILQSPPEPGDSVVVPHDLWPSYSCRELGGAGWEAKVVRLHRTAAVVHFTYHRTRDGRHYKDELIPINRLRTLSSQ